jgi:hypothetical protein
MPSSAEKAQESAKAAEIAVKTVVEHAQKSESAITPAKSSVAASSAAAMKSLGTLSQAAERVNAILADPEYMQFLLDTYRSRPAEVNSLPGPLKQVMATAMEYDKLAQGHEKPGDICTTRAEAQKYVDRLSEGMEQWKTPETRKKPHMGWLKSLGSAIASAYGFIDSLAPGEHLRQVAAFLSGFIHSPLHPLRYETEKAFKTSLETQKWLSPSWLGAGLGRRFSATQPIAVIDARYFYFAQKREHETDNGVEFTGSNVIAIRRGITSPEVILHEQLHYAASLGGGMDIRWKGDNHEPVIRNYISWLHEGLTEMNAQPLSAAHGVSSSYVAYMPNVLVGKYLEKIAGANTLRKAYLYGDFTDVRSALDRRLGKGTFDALLHQGNATEAVVFMNKKLVAAHVDRSAWLRDPLVAACRECMDKGMLSQVGDSLRVYWYRLFGRTDYSEVLQGLRQ